MRSACASSCLSRTPILPFMAPAPSCARRKTPTARSRLHRDMAAAAVKSGLHAPIELTRAEADLTRFDVGRIRAAGSLTTARVVFAAAVGLDDSNAGRGR